VVNTGRLTNVQRLRKRNSTPDFTKSTAKSTANSIAKSEAKPAAKSAPTLQRRLRNAALACFALSVGGLAVGGLAHSTPLVTSRAVPAYFSDDANWAKIKLQAGGITYAVMNPDSGPGAASDPSWVTRLATIGLTNPKIVGYVDTSYAAVPMATVQADILKYKNWYGVKSIFLDQTPFGCVTTSYYAEIAATVHANGGIVIMNPGTLPLNCMIDIADVIVSFENSLPYYLVSTATNPVGYAPQKFWHLIYAVPPNRQLEIEELARQRGAGLVYVTADDLPNPWSRVETFAGTPVTAPGTIIPNDATTTTAPSNTVVTSTTSVGVTTPSSTVPPTGPSTTPPTTTPPVLRVATPLVAAQNNTNTSAPPTSRQGASAGSAAPASPQSSTRRSSS
jgi:Spherulation-specific family 4